jgi:hypothetical protein
MSYVRGSFVVGYGEGTRRASQEVVRIVCGRREINHSNDNVREILCKAKLKEYGNQFWKPISV